MPPESDQPPSQPPGDLPRRSRRAARAAESEDSSWADRLGVQRGADTGFWGSPAAGTTAGSAEATEPPAGSPFRGWLDDAGQTGAGQPAAPSLGEYVPPFQPPGPGPDAPGRRPLPRRERARSAEEATGGFGATGYGQQPPGSPADVDPATRPWWSPGQGGQDRPGGPAGPGETPAAEAARHPAPSLNPGGSPFDVFARHPSDDGPHHTGAAIPAPAPQVPVAPLPLDAAPHPAPSFESPYPAPSFDSPPYQSPSYPTPSYEPAAFETPSYEHPSYEYEPGAQSLPRRKPSGLDELTPPPGLSRFDDAGSGAGAGLSAPGTAYPFGTGSAFSAATPLPEMQAPDLLSRDLREPAWPPIGAPAPVSPTPDQPVEPSLPESFTPGLPRRTPGSSAASSIGATGSFTLPPVIPGTTSGTTAAGLPQRSRRDLGDQPELPTPVVPVVDEPQLPPSNPVHELQDPPPASFAEVLNPAASIRRPLGGYSPPRRGSKSIQHDPVLTPFPDATSVPDAAASAAATAAEAAGAAAVLGSIGGALGKATRRGSRTPADDEGSTSVLPAVRRRRDQDPGTGGDRTSRGRSQGKGRGRPMMDDETSLLGAVPSDDQPPGGVDDSTRHIARVTEHEPEAEPSSHDQNHDQHHDQGGYDENFGHPYEDRSGAPRPWIGGVDESLDPPEAIAPEQDHGRAGRNLPAAIGVGVLLAAITLASLFTRPEAFVALVSLVVVLAVWELAGAMAAKQIIVPVIPLAVGSVGMLVSAYVAGQEGLLISFALTGVGVLLWRILEGIPGASRDVTAGIFTAAYVPLLAGFAILLLADDDGPQRVVTFILVTVCSDIGGYIAGVLFGKHPMSPTISPKKSWEGFAGSVVTCLIAGAACVHLLLHGPWWAGLLLGAAAAFTATIGDLSESLIKRDLGVKDMGSLLPGHGGIMDRLDSLLPNAPLAFLLLHYLVK